ncbi:MAG: efflux RND transporter periplasmic adaptor subunit [Gemmatimonadales bacterium]
MSSSTAEAASPRPVPARRIARLSLIIAGALLIALVLGVVPRLTRTTRLAAVVAANTGVTAVQVATINYAPTASSVTLPATLSAIENAPIYARVGGYIGRTLVDIGSQVHQGDLLARIEAPELDHQVEQARAAVAQARASLQLARVELARWQSMAGDSAVTADELDQKTAAFNVATATLNSTEANLRELRQLQSYEQVVAPFTGVIIARNVTAGALVGTAGAVSGSLPSAMGSVPGSLFQLARIDTLAVYVTVPEENADAVQVGKAAVVTVPAFPGDTLHGRIARTTNALDPNARTLLAEVDVANPSGTFLPGAYAQVQISLSRSRSALRVPATALVIRSGPPQVVTVGPDSTLGYSTVTIGTDYGSWVEVTGGLAPGATIVLNPTDDLQAGQRVRVATK